MAFRVWLTSSKRTSERTSERRYRANLRDLGALEIVGLVVPASIIEIDSDRALLLLWRKDALDERAFGTAVEALHVLQEAQARVLGVPSLDLVVPAKGTAGYLEIRVDRVGDDRNAAYRSALGDRETHVRRRHAHQLEQPQVHEAKRDRHDVTVLVVWRCSCATVAVSGPSRSEWCAWERDTRPSGTQLEPPIALLASRHRTQLQREPIPATTLSATPLLLLRAFVLVSVSHTEACVAQGRGTRSQTRRPRTRAREAPAPRRRDTRHPARGSCTPARCIALASARASRTMSHSAFAATGTALPHARRSLHEQFRALSTCSTMRASRRVRRGEVRAPPGTSLVAVRWFETRAPSFLVQHSRMRNVAAA